MEDHWFAYVEDATLYLHRSWTGFCIFTASFAREANGWVISEAVVTADRDRYPGLGDDREESRSLETLIDWLLLNVRRPR
jgi:8-oxo-dGTP diphosphatase